MQENLGVKAFTAGAAVEPYRRVKLDGINVIHAVSDEDCIGISQPGISGAGAASGETVSVALKSTGRTFKVMVNEAMTAGASFYGGLAGKIQDTDPGAGTIRGVVLEASAADEEIIEALFSA